MVNLNTKHRGQGFLLVVLIILYAGTFVLYALSNGSSNPTNNYQTQFYSFTGVNSSSDFQNASSGTTGYSAALYSQFQLSMGVGATSAFITAFGIGFPNYVGMFLLVAIGLIGMLSVPIALFNAEGALPDVVRVFLIAFFQFLIVIGVIGWLKGNTP